MTLYANRDAAGCSSAAASPRYAGPTTTAVFGFKDGTIKRSTDHALSLMVVNGGIGSSIVRVWWEIRQRRTWWPPWRRRWIATSTVWAAAKCGCRARSDDDGRTWRWIGRHE